MQVADTGIFENLKEKLANPILFTYFWVFCSWNIQNIFYLLYMPLKVDEKFIHLEGEWWIISPMVMTILFVFAFPWLNNFVELGRQKAHQWLQETLHRWGWKPMVEESIYQTAIDKINSQKSQLSALRENEEKLVIQLAELTKERSELESETKEKLSDNLIYYKPNSTFNEFTAAAEKLSKESLTILKGASLTPSKPIIAIDTKSGFHVKAGDSTIDCNIHNAHLLKYAISQLESSNFIKRTSKDSYLLTEVGNSIAKQVVVNK